MKAQTGVESNPQTIAKTSNAPFIVEAEKLFERMKEISQNISRRAYELFESNGVYTDSLNDWFRAESELLRPVPVEIKETQKQLVVRAEVPGYKAEDIEVSVEPHRLIISGKETSEEKKEVEKAEQTILNEFRSRQFFRSFELPTLIEPASAYATLKDGVLELLLNKEEPAKAATKVEVKPV